MQRTLKRIDEATADALDEFFASRPEHVASLYATVIGAAERPLIHATLVHADGNQSAAADMLGLSRATLRKKMRLHGVKLERAR